VPDHKTGTRKERRVASARVVVGRTTGMSASAFDGAALHSHSHSLSSPLDHVAVAQLGVQSVAMRATCRSSVSTTTTGRGRRRGARDRGLAARPFPRRTWRR
jgi:hypothetical protein